MRGETLKGEVGENLSRCTEAKDVFGIVGRIVQVGCCHHPPEWEQRAGRKSSAGGAGQWRGRPCSCSRGCNSLSFLVWMATLPTVTSLLLPLSFSVP